MMPEQPVEPIREAVGVFATFESLQSAIDELLTSGFDRAELSLLAGEHAVEEKLGHTYRRVAQLEDDETVPRTFYVNPESVGAAEGALVSALLYVGAVAGAGAIVATGGTLAAVIAGAALMGGAGGAIGTVLAVVVGEHHAQYLQEQLDHGGLLLWVRTWDADREKRAVGILEKHSGKDVHVHAIQ